MANNKKEQTRRDFLKTAGIAGVAATVAGILPGCPLPPEPGPIHDPNEPLVYDKTTEIVVVGAGFAGLASAITAFDAGAKVLLLEKAPAAYEGGNSRVCGQCFTVPTDQAQGVKYFKALAAGHGDDLSDALCNAWSTEMMKTLDWVERLLGNAMTVTSIFSPEIEGLDGSTYLKCYVNGSAGGGALYKPLRQAAAARGITVTNQAQVTKLYYNDNKIITGVQYTDLTTNKTVSIKATKAVILCLGGFEFNETLKHNYLAAPCYGFGSPYNTGDGIPMVQAVGADMWHMNNCAGPIWLGYLNPAIDPNFPTAPVQVTYNKADAIIVDIHGNRFMNEARGSLHGKGFHEFFHYEAIVDSSTTPHTGYYGFPRNPAWLVFGETAKAGGAIVGKSSMGWSATFRSYTWSADNSAEVAKGWILTDTTIEGLAAKMGLTATGATPAATAAANLKKTITQYNADAALTPPVDSVFGKTGIKPLITNYYAIPLVPGMVNTQGGPKYNEKAQVLDVKGNPITHLYKAGEFGAPYAWLYNGGFNVGECLAFGRVAGMNAVSEPYKIP